MKTPLTIILILSPLFILAQRQTGLRIYNNDSLKVEEYNEGARVRSTGTYSNGQKKYLRYLVKSQIVDTVKYFSKEGLLISEVNYEDLRYKLLDSSFETNYKFVDSCITLVKNQISKSFGNSIIHEYIFLDASNSSQHSRKFNKHSTSGSKLYEPENYPINSCYILVNFKFDENSRIGFLTSFRIDSTLNIVQSNLDLNSKQVFNISYEFAEDIKTQLNWQTGINEKQDSAIVIEGPFLEIRNKKLKWIIQKVTGKLNIKGEINSIKYDRYIEEIIINIETGEFKKATRDIGPVE